MSEAVPNLMMKDGIRNDDWSGELLSEDLSSLDADAISLARDLFKQNNPLNENIDRLNNEEFLSELGLIRDGRITRAAAILLGCRDRISDLGEPEISWVVKSGNNIVRDYRHLGIPFLPQFEEAISLITNRTYRRIMSGTSSEEMPTYSPSTLHEALLNSIIHCDYRKGMVIAIEEVQDKKIVFTNPGSFIEFSPESIALSARGIQRQRNPLLAKTMEHLGLSDSIGYGLRRMFISQMKRGFPLPEYELKDDLVSLTIIGHEASNTVARIAYFNRLMTLEDYLILDKHQKMKDLSSDDRMQYERIRRNLLCGRELPSPEPNLNSNERRIWNLIMESDGLSIPEISDILEMSYATARYNVKKLEDRGCIVKTKRGWVPIRYPSR